MRLCRLMCGKTRLFRLVFYQKSGEAQPRRRLKGEARRKVRDFPHIRRRSRITGNLGYFKVRKGNIAAHLFRCAQPPKCLFGCRKKLLVSFQRVDGATDQQRDDGQRDYRLEHRQNLCPARENRNVGRRKCRAVVK